MAVPPLIPPARRIVVCLALFTLAVSTSISVGVAAKPRVITQINAYTAAGSRVVFEGNLGPKNPAHYVLGKEGLWLQKFGSQKLKLIASPVSHPSGFCVTGNAWEIMSVAFGAKGTVGCLTVGGGISTTDVDVYVLLGNGKTRHLISREYSGGAEDDSPGTKTGLVPALFGDGRFLGFLEVDGEALKLFQITPSGKVQHVADLTGLSSCGGIVCGAASVDSGNIVIREAGDSYVHVFTTAGKPVATFSANPAGLRGSVAIRKNRIVVLTAAGQLAVYTLHGALVHSYPVHAASGSIATYYGYAAYLGSEHKSVHVLKLFTGKDREIARLALAGGRVLSLQAPGLAVSRLNQPSMLYVPMKKIRAKLG